MLLTILAAIGLLALSFAACRLGLWFIDQHELIDGTALRESEEMEE